MKFLVLGSEGQIGNHLCRYLENKGHGVAHFDIVRWELEDLRISDNEILKNELEKADFVYFLAFDVGGSKYLNDYQNSEEFMDNNLKIMINTFKALHEYKKPYVFASSQMASLTFSTYGVLKALGERMARKGLIARFWNVYGKESLGEKSHVITDFIEMALKDNYIAMRTSGQERRQFLYADDCSEALYVMSQNYDKLMLGNPYHVSSFVWSSILDVALAVARVVGDTIVQPGVLLDMVQRGTEVEPMASDIISYWKPKTSLEEGIKILVDYYKGKESNHADN